MPNLIGNDASLGIQGMNGNFGGFNQAVPSATSATGNTPAIGGSGNPLLPSFPGGTQTPPLDSSMGQALPTGDAANGGASNPGMQNNSGAMDPNSALTNIYQLLNGPQALAGQPSSFYSNLITGFKNAGFGSAQGSLLANFLQNGAGFNPAVAQALIAAMQPGIQQNEADIMEWMGSKGLSNSSTPAGYALSNYLGQVQLNEGQIWAGLYEQSVQNYMNVLMGSKQTHYGSDLLSQVMDVFKTLSGSGFSTPGGTSVTI